MQSALTIEKSVLRAHIPLFVNIKSTSVPGNAQSVRIAEKEGV